MNFSNIRYPALTAAALAFISAQSVGAYPEFQEYAEKKSGRGVDCAMCHVHEHGPVGDDDGQIGKLTDEELQLLNKSRGALEPGSTIHNPVLNRFGNEIVRSLGMKKVLQAKESPEKLVEMLGSKSDLDEDGVPDSQEYIQGTHPVNKYHGDPLALFINNLSKYKVQVALALVSIVLLNFGFVHLIKGLHLASKRRGGKTIGTI